MQHQGVSQTKIFYALNRQWTKLFTINYYLWAQQPWKVSGSCVFFTSLFILGTTSKWKVKPHFQTLCT